MSTPWHQRPLFAHLRVGGGAGLLAGLVLASVFILTTFSSDFVLGVAPYWQTETSVDDVAQAVAGFNMYFRAPWQWPLLAFDQLNYPVGTRVTFVDGIPLYALLLKALLPQALAPFNPFGFWIVICFYLQAIAAWWITRELEITSGAFLVTLTIVFVAYPALMARMGHISLMSHWIVLFAWALYLRGHRQSQISVTGWTVLLVISFHVNIYLFVMAAGFYGAAWLTSRSELTLRNVIRFVVPCLVLGTITWVTLLPLPASKLTTEWGFGYYSMNLLSPWTGGALIDWHVPERPGQYEGVNYLGAGVILALAGAIWMSRSEWIASARRHWAMLILLCAYTFYALSNHITFGDRLLTVLSYPSLMDTVTSQFRASGRFFWPVGYGCVIWALWVWCRHLQGHVLVISMMAVSLIQMVDLRDRHQALRATQARDAHGVIDVAVWGRALGAPLKVIYLYPKFKCGNQANGLIFPLMRYASERQVKLNTGYISRYTPDCNDVAAEIALSDPVTSAYVFHLTEFQRMSDIQSLFPVGGRLDCHALELAHVCRFRNSRPASPVSTLKSLTNGIP